MHAESTRDSHPQGQRAVLQFIIEGLVLNCLSILLLIFVFNLFLDFVLVLCDSKNAVPQAAPSLASLTLCRCRTFPLTMYSPERLSFAVQRWV